MEGARTPLSAIYRFDRFILDLHRGMLLSADRQELPLRPKAFVLLRTLVENAGQLLDRNALMAAVWPGAFVTDESISQCIKDVRKALGDERQLLLRTVVKRGYILTAQVTSGRHGDDRVQSGVERSEHPTMATTRLADGDIDAGLRSTQPVRIDQASSHSMPDDGMAGKAPRLSLVLAPFENLGGDSAEDYLAAAITEDLTTDLCRLDGARVIAGQSSAAWKDKSRDVRQVGETLGVRYVVEGSVRKLGDLLRVNVHLISTESNTYLWAGRFDHSLKDASRDQEEIVSRLRAELIMQMLAVENTRSMQERPDNPDAFDLLLRARAMFLQHEQTESARNASELLEHALRLDPSSVPAMCHLAGQLLNRVTNVGDDQGNEDLLEQAASLVTAAAAIEPNSEAVLHRQGYLLRALGRWTEAIVVLQRVVELSPRFNDGLRLLGFCKLAVGQAAAAISLLERSIYLDPLAPPNRYAYCRLAQAHIVLGADSDAIDCAQRALATGGPPRDRASCYLLMASAYALSGQRDAARRALDEATRLDPHDTVRTTVAAISQRGLPDPVHMAQMFRMRQGLRIAGLRENAREDADFGVVSNGALRYERSGLTPRTIPGAKTIYTSELVDLLSRRKPLLIDAALRSCGWSLPGALGLQGLGHGGAFSDRVQTRFRRKIYALTNGNLSSPIVAYCANSERFAGYNLVLRLVALGYAQVYWYRGGWEAWQVACLPETELEVQNW